MTRRSRTNHLCASVLSLVASIAATAAAQSGTQQAAVARGLFDQARDLMKKGQFKEACPKLEESQRLDPGVGTQFNLAYCYENTGRKASAWSLYLEVAAQAHASGQEDREREARKSAAALQGNVPKVVLEIPANRRVPGLVVNLDSTPLGEASWGTPIPVDTGAHKVQVSAPGRKPWSTAVTAADDGRVLTVTVPALDPVSDSTPQPEASSGAGNPAPPIEPSSWGTQKTVSVIVAGVGLVGLGVGTALAFSAKSRYNESSSHCEGDLCDQQGLDIRDEARSTGNIATILGGVGVAALGTGAVLFLLAPSKRASAEQGLHSTSVVGIGPGWMTLGGRW